MQAVLKNARISPIKARVIAKIIRKKSAEKALIMLKLMPKKSAKLLYEVLLSAIANAKNNFGQDVILLYISNVQINKATVYKRHLPRSRGRVAPIKKQTSHIRIEVAVKKDEQKEKNKKKKEVISK